MAAIHEGIVSNYPAARRSANLDALRILAALAVVTIHVSGIAMFEAKSSADWWITNFFDAFSRWSVPVFVMISGALLIPRAGVQTPRSFIVSRMGRVLPALIFWTLFYFAAFPKGLDVATALTRLWLGEPYYHLWYLYMALGLYCAAPFVAATLEVLPQNQSFAMAGLILVVASLGSLLGVRGPFFTLFLPYLGYFVFGYLLNRARPTVRLRALVAVFVACGVWIAVAAAGPSERAADIAYGYFNAPVIIQSLAMFLAFQRIPALPRLERFERYAFGIYLLHPLWIAVLAKIGVTGLTIAPTLGVPLTVGLTALLSAASTHFLLSVPGLRRLV